MFELRSNKFDKLFKKLFKQKLSWFKNIVIIFSLKCVLSYLCTLYSYTLVNSR